MIQHNQMIEFGHRSMKVKINNKAFLGNKLWVENYVKTLNERNMMIKNGNDTAITKSKTSMKMAKECAETQPKTGEFIEKVNHGKL